MRGAFGFVIAFALLPFWGQAIVAKGGTKLEPSEDARNKLHKAGWTDAQILATDKELTQLVSSFLESGKMQITGVINDVIAKERNTKLRIPDADEIEDWGDAVGPLVAFLKEVVQSTAESVMEIPKMKAYSEDGWNVARDLLHELSNHPNVVQYLKAQDFPIIGPLLLALEKQATQTTHEGLGTVLVTMGKDIAFHPGQWRIRPYVN